MALLYVRLPIVAHFSCRRTTCMLWWIVDCDKTWSFDLIYIAPEKSWLSATKPFCTESSVTIWAVHTFSLRLNSLSAVIQGVYQKDCVNNLGFTAIFIARPSKLGSFMANCGLFPNYSLKNQTDKRSGIGFNMTNLGF